MKYLLFGTGEYYKRYRKWFAQNEIAAILDNAEDRQGTTIDGIAVCSPQEGVRLAFDAVVILSFYVREMKEQLLALGVSEERIYHFFDLHRLLGGVRQQRPIRYYGDAARVAADMPSGRGRALLLSHDLTLGGPAIALLNAAVCLRDAGYQVLFVSMLEGPLAELLAAHGIPTAVDENLQIQTMAESRWNTGYDLILCNTLAFFVFLSERNTEAPVIWWLHDSRFFYDGVDAGVMERIPRKNLYLASVGPVPEQAIREFLPDIRAEKLLYGVADFSDSAGGADVSGRAGISGGADASNRAGISGSADISDVAEKIGGDSDDKITFVTAGFIEWRKGQDILIEAVLQLPADILRSCRFLFVGQQASAMAARLQDKAKETEQIQFVGTVDRSGMHRILSAADVLVCPSREDPMPTVAAEAMMHAVPCLVSDAVGTAACLSDGTDGLIFASGNVRQLKERIIWCAANRGRLKEMGKQARGIFERYFSMDVFRDHILRLAERPPGNNRFLQTVRDGAAYGGSVEREKNNTVRAWHGNGADSERMEGTL